MAASCHQLAMNAMHEGRLAEAEQLHRQALAIREELGDRSGMAASYHELGILAVGQSRPQEAQELFMKSLGITKELGDPTAMAATYHQLGMTARALGRADLAETGTARRWRSSRSSGTGVAWRRVTTSSA